MSEQEYDHEESSVAGGGSRRQSNPLVVLFVLVMLIIGLVVSLAHGGGGNNSSTFSAQQQGYLLLQQLEATRVATPTPENYCKIAIWLGAPVTPGLTPAPGTVVTGSAGNPVSVTAGPTTMTTGSGAPTDHCEQKLLRWVQFDAFPKQIFPHDDLRVLGTIVIILVSQVRVCRNCQPTFQGWQQRLQQLVQQQPGGNAVVVKLFVYDLDFSPSGFDPVKYPAGPDTPGPAKPNSRKPVSIVGHSENVHRAFP